MLELLLVVAVVALLMLMKAMVVVVVEEKVEALVPYRLELRVQVEVAVVAVVLVGQWGQMEVLDTLLFLIHLMSRQLFQQELHFQLQRLVVTK
jgi:hypothetical protein